MNELDGLIGELHSVAERLRSDAIEPEEAASLVERLAQTAATLGAALEREARTPAPGESPGQETLL